MLMSMCRAFVESVGSKLIFGDENTKFDLSFDSSTSEHEHDPFLNVLSRSNVLLYVQSHAMGFVADL
jgi:hypothetical protein